MLIYLYDKIFHIQKEGYEQWPSGVLFLFPRVYWFENYS